MKRTIPAMQRVLSVLPLGVLLTTTLTPLTSRGQADTAASKITYDDHVDPIFRTRCFGCHDQNKRKGGLALTTYSVLLEGGSSGEVIQPGDPDGSRLFSLVSRQERPFMPPQGDKLPDAELKTLREWIGQGALENKGSKALLPKKPKLDLVVQGAPDRRPEGPPPMPRGLSLEPVTHTTKGTAVAAMAASPWAPLCAVAGQKQVLLYDFEACELLGILPFPEGVAHALKFSRNGSLLLAGGGRGAHSGKVVAWNVKTGDRVLEFGEELDSVLAADISADQSLVAFGGPSKMLRIYSTRDGRLLHDIKKHTDWIYAVEFSPDGVLLASADRNGGLFVWESFTGREFLNLRGHGGAVTDVSWRSDSNILASSSEDGTIRLWELENGNQIKTWNAHGGGTLSLEFFRDGRLASCGRDRLAKVWDQNGGQQRAFDAFTDLALRVAVNHDGELIAAGDWTGEIRVWSVADGKRVSSLPTTPPALDQRLELAAQELEARTKEHETLSAKLSELKATAEKAAAEFAAKRESLAALDVRRKEAASRLDVARNTVQQATESLTQTLARLSASEEALQKAAKAGNSEAAKKAEAALADARKSAREAATRVKEEVEARVAAHEALHKTRAESARTAQLVKEIEERLKSTSEEAQRQQAALGEKAARVSEAQLVVDKWQAAKELDNTRREIERLEALDEQLTLALAELAAAEKKTVEELAAAERATQESTQKAKAATTSAVKRGAELLGALQAPSAKAAAVLEEAKAIAGRGEGEALGELASRFAALQKASADFSRAAKEANDTWLQTRAEAEQAAQKAKAALEVVEKHKSDLQSLREKAKEQNPKLERTAALREEAKKLLEKWTAAFEKAAAGGT